MKQLTILFFASVVMALAVTQSAATRNPRSHDHRDRQHTVFVQTNEPNGNRIVVFDRGANGQLSQAGTYATGGNGGIAAPGDESDHPASQGSLVYDWRHSLLIAVNAGSDTVSTFKGEGELTPADRRRPVRGRVPGEHCRLWQSRLRPELGRPGDSPGVRHPRPPASGVERLDAIARAFEHRPAELPDIARSGRVHPRWRKAHRHDEGQRQQHRRLPRTGRRPAFHPGRQRVGDTRSVRIHLRPSPAARVGRGNAKLRDHVHDQRKRHARQPTVAEQQPDGAVLDRPRSRLLLRGEHREQLR